ncbi:MAG: phosphate/phosphite/phosphonate ABC transporter substrate-binding protein [Actinomycetota bacterium]|nr:phosphate/phosphite/phosphonate ABC transporter substrate-binding protein [Actinomycetota bacterium]
MGEPALVMGAVAYDPKVVTIWEGFKAWFARAGLAFDYILYSNYERQVEDLIAGHVDVAWNSPLAWLRARRMAGPAGVAALAMRDSDCDLTSVVVVGADSGIEAVGDLRGHRVAVGAVDSPQATLIPLGLLAAQGLRAGHDFEVVFHDIGVGKHGDHVGGERDAARALLQGEAEAACMIDGNLLAFGAEGTVPAGAARVLVQSPVYDHCNFTALATPDERLDRFRALLLGMEYADREVRPLLDLEGLKAWRKGRTTGYGLLDAAVTQFGFYDDHGNVTAAGYRP